MPLTFQTPKDAVVDRKEHVWTYRSKDRRWRCVLCGAVCKVPPPYPTPPGWLPEGYEPLTREERAACPNPVNVRPV
jgi:hypothetical protein